jgi:hypothetical protein
VIITNPIMSLTLARQSAATVFQSYEHFNGSLNAVTSSDLPTVLFSEGWSFAILLTAVFDPRIATTGRTGLTPLRAQALQPSAPNQG